MIPRRCLSIASLCLSAAACSPQGQVAGPPDTHCAGVAAPVIGVCEASSTAAAAPADQRIYYGNSAQDDDCKYHLEWTVGDASSSATTSVRLTLTDGGSGPVSGAQPTVTTTMGGRVTPQAGATATETDPGVYLITPIKFSGAGRWTVRFDLFGQCADVADPSGNASPRAHAAFYLDVS